MKVSRVFIASMIAVFAIGATVATAHTAKYRTRVTIHFSGGPYGNSFFGKVKSRKAACVRHRKVKVFRQKPGADKQFGTTSTSDTAGNWNVTNGNASPGDYYAKAKRKVLKHNANHFHVCKRGRSATISVP
jgi:hypothetical protein